MWTFEYINPQLQLMLTCLSFLSPLVVIKLCWSSISICSGLFSLTAVLFDPDESQGYRDVQRFGLSSNKLIHYCVTNICICFVFIFIFSVGCCSDCISKHNWQNSSQIYCTSFCVFNFFNKRRGKLKNTENFFFSWSNFVAPFFSYF